MDETAGSSELEVSLTKSPWVMLFERRSLIDRPRWLLAPSLLSMLLAVGSALIVMIAANGGIFCTVTSSASGTDIPLAAQVVLATCSFGFIAGILVRERPLLLSLAVLLAASSLLAGVVLVACDSAVMTAVEKCTLIDTTTETATTHFSLVYIVWGVALAVLLVELPRAIKFFGRSAF